VWIDRAFFASRVRYALAGVVNDSKRLSPGAREEIHALLGVWEEAGAVRAAQATASVLEIDAFNILGATRLAMQRCLQALSAGAGGGVFLAATAGMDTPLFCDDGGRWPLVLVDGRALKPFAWRHRALVGGDGRSFAIALASVLAKVRRDRLMRELDARYPQYGFAEHKGYGTAAHVAAIRRHGPCEEHRPLFLRSVLGGAGGGGAVHPEFAF
jgi:ribonuclease HII